MKPATRPINVVSDLNGADPLDVRSGKPIAPIERLKIFSAQEWEEFVDEWTRSLDQYALVERTGGSGDMGLDIIGTVTEEPDSPWDNYQCKHYDHPLAPSDVWVELGKLCFYTFQKDYTLPRSYFFVAPRGVGTSLTHLLKNPTKLKEQFIANWDKYCRTRILTNGVVELSPQLRAHIEGIDFSIFKHVPALTLIEGHRRTPYYTIRFGGGIPPRPPVPAPPTTIAPSETRYVEQLFEAYSDHLKATVSKVSQLSTRLARHFSRSRESFYCAEALRNFSRDTLPSGAFEHLQEQIYHGVVDVVETEHTSGYVRVTETTKQAASVDITSSALLGRTDVLDRYGICHQLANENRLIWVPKED